MSETPTYTPNTPEQQPINDEYAEAARRVSGIDDSSTQEVSSDKALLEAQASSDALQAQLMKHEDSIVATQTEYEASSKLAKAPTNLIREAATKAAVVVGGLTIAAGGANLALGAAESQAEYQKDIGTEYSKYADQNNPERTTFEDGMNKNKVTINVGEVENVQQPTLPSPEQQN